jgi:hypothetical protein
VEAGHGNQPCLLFEGNDPGSDKVLTYQGVLSEVSRLVSADLPARFPNSFSECLENLFSYCLALSGLPVFNGFQKP